jgi:hypothetical protein
MKRLLVVLRQRHRCWEEEMKMRRGGMVLSW